MPHHTRVHRNPFIFKTKRKCYTHTHTQKDRGTGRPKFTRPTFIEISRKKLSKVKKTISRRSIWQFFIQVILKISFLIFQNVLLEIKTWQCFDWKWQFLDWPSTAYVLRNCDYYIDCMKTYNICHLWLFFRWRKTQEPLVPHIYHKRR